jgi:hypothetical protein
MADDLFGAADGASSPELQQAALDAAVKHLVGESRAWLHQVENYLNELSSLRDERTERVIAALGLTAAETAEPGTLRHLEQAATALLRTLTEIVETVRP